MTYKDLLLEIVADATGKPLTACEEILLSTEQGRIILAGPQKELSEKEANTWRAKLKNEMPGILSWLSRETMIQQPPKGSA